MHYPANKTQDAPPEAHDPHRTPGRPPENDTKPGAIAASHRAHKEPPSSTTTKHAGDAPARTPTPPLEDHLHRNNHKHQAGRAHQPEPPIINTRLKKRYSITSPNGDETPKSMIRPTPREPHPATPGAHESAEAGRHHSPTEKRSGPRGAGRGAAA